LTSIVYPDGYAVDYNYDSGTDSTVSRVSSISDSSGALLLVRCENRPMTDLIVVHEAIQPLEVGRQLHLCRRCTRRMLHHLVADLNQSLGQTLVSKIRSAKMNLAKGAHLHSEFLPMYLLPAQYLVQLELTYGELTHVTKPKGQARWRRAEMGVSSS
jgi:hypothetical protein